MEQLLSLPNQDQLNALLSGDGNSTAGISEIEAQHLAWLGSMVPIGGSVVEIGSHRGKSICCIGSGALSSGNTKAKLFCVDLWTTGVTTFEHYKSTETWEIFQRQIEECGIKAMVKPVVAASLHAVQYRKNLIDLLFIDASHKYKDVHADYTAWHKFVQHGGRIAFHDYGGRFTGVTKTIDETVIPSGLWTDFRKYGRIWSATRK